MRDGHGIKDQRDHVGGGGGHGCEGSREEDGVVEDVAEVGMRQAGDGYVGRVRSIGAGFGRLVRRRHAGIVRDDWY